MVQSYEWKPDPMLWEQVLDLAQKRGQSPESIMDEAIQRYLDDSIASSSTSNDSLVGLYEGSANIATDSESILQEAANSKSGWTWKEKLP